MILNLDLFLEVQICISIDISTQISDSPLKHKLTKQNSILPLSFHLQKSALHPNPPIRIKATSLQLIVQS
jgi:hypothetical protein